MRFSSPPLKLEVETSQKAAEGNEGIIQDVVMPSSPLVLEMWPQNSTVQATVPSCKGTFFSATSFRKALKPFRTQEIVRTRENRFVQNTI